MPEKKRAAKTPPEEEWWKQNRLSLFTPSCQETMGQHIDKYLLPLSTETEN
jgi:hypothetical protein